MIDYLPPKTTMSGKYYANLMTKLREEIKEKRRGKLSAGILLLHDNAPVHKADVVIDAIRECKFKQLDHPPYSPDIAPRDYYLFRELKKVLRGKRFNCISEVISETESFFDKKEKTFFSDGLIFLKHRYEKCIELKGEYIEKIK